MAGERRAPTRAPGRAAPPAPRLAAPFEGYTPGERIARAVAAVIAEKGYGAMSTDDIAARAAISLSTFTPISPTSAMRCSARWR